MSPLRRHTTPAGPIGDGRQHVVNDPAGGRDINSTSALAAGQRRQAKTPSLRLLGEAKSSHASAAWPTNRLDRIAPCSSPAGSTPPTPDCCSSADPDSTPTCTPPPPP